MTFKRILVPVDGSHTSNKALVAALQLARDGGGRVRLFHSLDLMPMIAAIEYSGDIVTVARDEATRVLADAMAVAKAAGVEADSRLAEFTGQRLGDSVAAEATEWDADLIVVGTHGRRGVGRVMLGSGAEQIIRTAPVPVLSVRGEAA